MPRRNEACQERDRLAAAGDSASKTPADSRLRAELPAFQFVPVIGLSGGFSTVRGSSRTGSRDRPTWASAADLEVCPTTCRTLQQTFVLSAPLEFDAPILLSRGERSRIISSWQTKI